jgi:hypothetical protein
LSVADVMVLLVVGVLLAFALRGIRRKGSSCDSCSSSAACHGAADAPVVCPRTSEAIAAAERKVAAMEERRPGSS